MSTQDEEEVKGETGEPQINYINILPAEIIMEIFKFLDVGTFLKACPLISKEWN